MQKLEIFTNKKMPIFILGLFCTIGSAHARLSDAECNTIKVNYAKMQSNYNTSRPTSCGDSYVSLYDGHFVALRSEICTCLANGSENSQCKALDDICCTTGEERTYMGNHVYKYETYRYDYPTYTCKISKTEYGCEDSYYDTDGNFSTSGCTICPNPDFYTNSALTTQKGPNTSGIGKNRITDCYISQGPTFYDTTGSFSLTDKCYY